MHIGFVTSEYPHQKIKRNAGIGTSIKNLAHGLIKAGVDVSVFVYSQDQDEHFDDENIRVFKIKKKNYRFLTWYFQRKYINKKINQIVLDTKIDILEIPDWTGISAFMNFDCKTLLKIHGSDTYFCHLEKRKQKRKNYFFEKKAFRNADKIAAVSSFSADVSKKVFQSNRDITVLPNLVDVDTFSNNQEVTDSKELLYYGTIIRKKGVLELVQIFNHLVEMNDDVRLKIVGQEAIDAIENISTLQLFKEMLTAKAKERFIYIDKVPYNEIVKLVSSSLAIVLPSFAEALPMTWLESMSLSKVLFASDIGWSKEIIDDKKDGFALPPKEHNRFASAINEVISNKSLMKEIGENAREKIVKNFSEKVVVKKHIEFYSKMISNEI